MQEEKKFNLTIKKEDLVRIQKLLNSGEKNFPILAMHSLVERELYQMSKIGKKVEAKEINPRDINFSTLIGRMKNYRKISEEQLKILNQIQNDRINYTNGIRHSFDDILEVKADFIAGHVVSFLESFGRTNNDKEYMAIFSKLKEEIVQNVKNRKQGFSSKESEALIKKLAELENELIHYKETEKNYQKVLEELQVLDKKTEKQYAEYEKQKKAWDEKNNKLRNERYALNNENKELKKEREKLKEEGELHKEETQKKDQEIKAKEEQLKEKDNEIKQNKKEKEEANIRHEAEIGKLREENDKMSSKLQKYSNTIELIQWLPKLFSLAEDARDARKKYMELSPAQKEIVASMADKDFYVKGSAGSGKTLVLTECMVEKQNTLFSEDKSQRETCCFLTYTNVLASFSKINDPKLKNLKNTEFSTVDSLIREMIKKIFDGKKISYQKEYYNNLLTAQEKKDSLDEIELFIWPKCISSKEEYLACNRKGMKSSINRNERERIWNTVEQLEKKIRIQNIWPKPYAVKRLLQEIESNPKPFEYYKKDYYLVDEAQDLPMSTLKLLKKLSKKAIYLAGDLQQSIYPRAEFTFKEIGINIEGRTKILNECYRNTIQINAVGEQYRKLAQIGEKEQEGQTSFYPGPPVVFSWCAANECATNICKKINSLIELKMAQPNEMCILTYTKEQAEAIEKVLKENEIEATIINRDNIKVYGKSKTEVLEGLLKEDSVKIMTVFTAKGLEFPCVFFFGQEHLPKTEGLDKETLEKQKKNVVYVAITRANSFLNIYADKDSPSEALQLLDKVVNKENAEINSDSV